MVSDLKIMLVGVGLYAKSCYLNHFIKNQYTNAHLVACVDLIGQSNSVINYLNDFSIHQRPQSYFLTKQTREPEKFTTFLNSIVKKHGINAVIISTPPEYRLAYLYWALENGLHTFSDKPLTTPKNCSVDIEATNQLIEDYKNIVIAYQKAFAKDPNLVFDLMVQRRYHPIYNLVLKKIEEVAEYTGCGLTHFQLTHADGQWRLPNEIIELDYHGFDNGNGKTSHSGYHFFDFATNAVVKSMIKAGKNIDQVRAYTTGVFPQDLGNILTIENYQKLFGKEFNQSNRYSQEEYMEATNNFGEVDAISNLTYLNKGKVIATGSLNLLHNSFSGRYWIDPNLEDLYRSNGRLRQELHYYVQGPFQSISITSLRGCSKVEIKKRVVESSNVRDSLELHIFRNTGVNSNWRAYDRYTIPDLIPDLKDQDAHLGYARDLAIKEFVSNILFETKVSDRHSHLTDHRLSIVTMATVCKSLAKGNVHTEDFVI